VAQHLDSAPDSVDLDDMIGPSAQGQGARYQSLGGSDTFVQEASFPGSNFEVRVMGTIFPTSDAAKKATAGDTADLLHLWPHACAATAPLGIPAVTVACGYDDLGTRLFTAGRTGRVTFLIKALSDDSKGSGIARRLVTTVAPAFVAHVQALGLTTDAGIDLTSNRCPTIPQHARDIVADVNFSCTAGWVGDFEPADGTHIAGGALVITPPKQTTPSYYFGPTLLNATVASVMTLHGYGNAGLLARATLRHGVVASEYLCQISTDGYAACLVYRHGGYKTLAQWRLSAAVHARGPNTLSMTMRGNSILFRVNGLAIAVVHDRTGPALKAGRWGIAPSRYGRPFMLNTTRVVMKRL
jgi:hypothetical protein